MLKKWTTYISYCCMMVFIMLTCSCERDTWLVDNLSAGSGDPVNVLLAFEVPSADKVAVTRTMSELEEHNIKDLYVLVFDAEDAAHGYPLISRQYFDESAVNVDKTDHANGPWSSVLDGTGNSTHGVVMVKALKKSCFVFGIANVRGDDSEVARSTTSAYSTLDDALLAMKTIAEEGTPSTLEDFYNLQAELRSDITLGRNNSHLLMSGVFVPKDRYRPAGYDPYGSKYTRAKAGLIDIGQTNVVNELTDPNGNVDLTRAGVIRLRRLASHITFKIKINDDVFKDFKPESWRVVHVPKRSYLMDRGDETPKLTGDGYFMYPDPQKSMIHADGTYQFDFYMYENHKEARDIHDINESPLWGAMSDADKTIVNNSYYLPQFGYTINDTDTSGGFCQKLSSLFDDDAEAFKYYKRDLALKSEDGQYKFRYIDTNKVKEFVYVEPNATYVEIKGRLRFDTGSFHLEDLIKRGDDKSTDADIKDGYADVTYLLHLGYARKMNLTEEVTGTGSESEAYKMTDFNSMRNTEYTYNVEIQGVNSIFTQVVTESDDDVDKRESAKLQAGASGFIGMASEDVFNTDAHFNAFNIFLDVAHLDIDQFSFVINTPWSEIDSKSMTDVNYNDPASKYYKFNSDFTWIKVRRNYEQTMGNNDDFVRYMGNENRKTMPYFKAQAGMSDDTYESTYHFKANPLIDLYQLKKEATLLSTTGLPITLGGTAYTARLESDGTAKHLYYYAASNPSTPAGELEGLFYTVYLDEYYYNTPPKGQTWTQPYWHEFVNRPARYVSFSTNTVGVASTTFDKESSIIKPQLMVVQPSIQSHYATDGGIIVGLGMEHYNETPHPRWTDKGPGPTIPTSNYTGDKKKFGWINAKDNIVGKSNVTWDNYVADFVGNNNNLAMKPNLVGGKVPTVVYNKGTDDDAQYKAGAIRLCMNRNRDENGNGVIDENELKWYLPASEQLDIISMCHYSFYDPLLNYNDYIYGTDADGTTFRLKNFQGTYTDITGGGNMRGANFYQVHYVASDYMKLTAEEMMNLNKYSTYANYYYNTGEMRCVRNLGEEADDSNTGKEVLKPYSSYGDGGEVTIDVSDARKELQTYTGSRPHVMFDFTKKEVQKDGKWIFTDKIFVMEKYLDSRSIRTAKYVNEELPPHYLYSETDRPYKAFQVAQNEVYMNIKDPRWTVKYGDAVYVDLERIYSGRPCGEYWEEDDQSDLGSWRAPNAAEISLMVHYLRINDPEGKANDSTKPALFFSERDPFPFTCTSWNFAGRLWGRMVAIKSDDPRKLWMSDPYKVSSSGAASNFTFGEGTKALYYNTVPLRCVKDVEPPLSSSSTP